MFNALMDMHRLFFLMLLAFFIIFTVRQIFIKRKIFVILYHVSLCCVLFFAIVAGSGVQNRDYDMLQRFIALEQANVLEQARQDPENYDRELASYLYEFKNSAAFRDSLKYHDIRIDKLEAVFIGWVFGLIAELSMLCVLLINTICNRNAVQNG